MISTTSPCLSVMSRRLPSIEPPEKPPYGPEELDPIGIWNLIYGMVKQARRAAEMGSKSAIAFITSETITDFCGTCPDAIHADLESLWERRRGLRDLRTIIPRRK